MKPLTEKPPTMTEAHRDVLRQAEVHSFTAREAEFAHEKMRDIRDNIASQVRGESLLVERAELEALREIAAAAESVDWYVHSPGAVNNQMLEAIAAVSGVHADGLYRLHETLERNSRWLSSPSPTTGKSELQGEVIS